MTLTIFSRRSLFVLTLCGALVLLWGCKGEKTEVDVDMVQLRQIVETVSASGKIEPEIEVKITSEVSGQIVELPVKEGDYVEKGQLLIRINPDLYESAVKRSDAALNTSRSNLANAKARLAQVQAQFVTTELSYNRNKNLHSQGAISNAEWENIEATFAVGKAEVEAALESVSASEFAILSAQATKTEAADNLKRTTIFAPQSGTVTALTKELGESVLGNQMMAGEVIMKVSELQDMEVNVEVNESDIVRVSLGDTTSVEVDAYQDEIFKGVVTEIGNTALNSLGLSMDQVTNFSVKVSILRSSYAHLNTTGDEKFSPFRPGMSATVEIETAKVNNVLSVPIRAVTSREDTTQTSALDKFRQKQAGVVVDDDQKPVIVVFVLEGDKAVLRAVKTGVQDSRYIHIVEGLNENEEVITGPYELVSRKLKKDQSVTRRKNFGKEEDES
jgi:HlyD family secretion protein